MRFDACAHTYDAHAVPQRAFAENVAAFARVSKGEEVLEFGAGSGALTRFLCSTEGIRVRATDISEGMVRIGKTAVPEAEWSVLDAFAGTIPGNPFQISSGLLQWADDPVRVLRLWGRSLFPSGRMVHAFPCEPCLWEWRDVVPESPLVWRDPSAWLGVFARAGMRVLRHEQWVERHLFASALEMLRGLHESGVTGRARLGSGRLRQGIRSYERRHRIASGVPATWAWMAVEAALPAQPAEPGARLCPQNQPQHCGEKVVLGGAGQHRGI